MGDLQEERVDACRGGNPPLSEVDRRAPRRESPARDHDRGWTDRGAERRAGCIRPVARAAEGPRASGKTGGGGGAPPSRGLATPDPARVRRDGAGGAQRGGGIR